MARRAPNPQGARGLNRRYEGSDLPRPTLQFRLHAWRTFQRALDPLGPQKPLRRLPH